MAKRFKYRFEALRRLHELARDEAFRRLAEAQQAGQVLRDRLAELEQQRQGVRQSTAGQIVGQISLDALLDQGRYDVHLELQQREIRQQLGQIEEEIERRAQRVTLAEQEYRKFEKLKEHALEDYGQAQLRDQQAQLDEIASQRAGLHQGDA